MLTIKTVVDNWATEQALDANIDTDKLMRIIRNVYLTGFISGVMVGDKGDPLPPPDVVWEAFEARDLTDPMPPETPSVVVPLKPKLII